MIRLFTHGKDGEFKMFFIILALSIFTPILILRNYSSLKKHEFHESSTDKALITLMPTSLIIQTLLINTLYFYCSFNLYIVILVLIVSFIGSPILLKKLRQINTESKLKSNKQHYSDIMPLLVIGSIVSFTVSIYSALLLISDYIGIFSILLLVISSLCIVSFFALANGENSKYSPLAGIFAVGVCLILAFWKSWYANGLLLSCIALMGAIILAYMLYLYVSKLEKSNLIFQRIANILFGYIFLIVLLISIQ